MRAMRRPVRPIGEAFQSVSFIARQPSMQGLPMDAPIVGHLGNCPTVADNRQDCFVPLLRHAHLPHARECHASTEVAVTHQPKVWSASPDGLLMHVSRTSTRNWLRYRPSVGLQRSYFGTSASLPVLN